MICGFKNENLINLFNQSTIDLNKYRLFKHFVKIGKKNINIDSIDKGSQLVIYAYS